MTRDVLHLPPGQQKRFHRLMPMQSPVESVGITLFHRLVAGSDSRGPFSL
jgi:hypothetical protein